jgi:hypothetical protein
MGHFLSLKGARAIQAVLDFKEPRQAAKEFWNFDDFSSKGWAHFIKELEDVAQHVNEDTVSLIVEIIKMFAVDDSSHLKALVELAKIPHLVLNAERRTIEGQLTALIDGCSSKVFEALQGLPEEFLTQARARRAAKIALAQSAEEWSVTSFAYKVGKVALLTTDLGSGAIQTLKAFLSKTPLMFAGSVGAFFHFHLNKKSLGDTIIHSVQSTRRCRHDPIAAYIISQHNLVIAASASTFHERANATATNGSSVAALTYRTPGVTEKYLVKTFVATNPSTSLYQVSLAESIGSVSACVIMGGLFVAHPVYTIGSITVYSGAAIGASYASYIGYANPVVRLGWPDVAVDHAVANAGDPVIALLARVLKKNVDQLRDEAARTRVASLSPDDPCSRSISLLGVGGLCRDIVEVVLRDQWIYKLTNDLRKTIRDAMEANKTIILSDTETFSSSTKTVINCAIYNKAAQVIEDITTEQISLVGRFIKGVNGVLIWANSLLGDSEYLDICQEAIKRIHDEDVQVLHEWQLSQFAQASMQAVLNFKEPWYASSADFWNPWYASADFWNFDLSSEDWKHFIKEVAYVAEHVNEDTAILIVEIIKMFAGDDAYAPHVIAELAKIPNLVLNAERRTIEGQLTDLIDECDSEVFEALQGLPEEFLTHARAARSAGIGVTQSTAAHTEELEDIDTHASEESAALIVETIKLFANDPFTLKALPEIVNIPNLSDVLHAERANIERRLNALVDGDNSKVFEVLQSLSGSTQWNFSLPSLAKWSCELKEARNFFSDECVTEFHSSYNKFKADSVICACTKDDNSTLTAFIKLEDDGRVVRPKSVGCEKIASANQGNSLSIPDTYVEHELPACSGEVSSDLHVYVKSVS